MIQAFAPRNLRGYSWVLLTIVALLTWSGVAAAQSAKGRRGTATGKAKADATKETESKPKAEKGDSESSKPKDDESKEPAAKKKGEQAEKPAEEPEAAEKEPAIEVFKDPRAEAILQKKNFPVVGKVAAGSGLKRTVVNMASGGENSDKATIERFVEGETYRLTNHANVAALVQGQGGSKALEIKDATADLLEVLHRAQQAKNAAFLKDYNAALLNPAKGLPKLLENNLFARIEAMIILGQTGTPQAFPIYVKHLGDSNQTVWVKIWAARGITSAAGSGTRELQPSDAVPAAKALAEWLQKEKDLPWFAQMRALEALGALRLAKTPQAPTKPDFANLAMQFLADKEARPEVRAMAAWALGMMRIDSALSKFNFALVGYNIGEVAADLGAKANEVFDKNHHETRYYTSFLLYQIHPALEGVPNVRDAGLLKVPGGHPSFTQAKPFLQQLDSQVKPVYQASVELLNAPRGKYKDMQKQLANRVASLRAFLEKNPPSDAWLVPGGPEFPGNVGPAAAGGK